ncbi:MAG: choice-of-anchor B family protein [Balneola sp.]
MKYKIIIPILLITFFGCKTNSTEPGEEIVDPPFEPTFACVDGLADGKYPCDNIDLLSVVTPQELEGLDSDDTPNVRLNDIWGWTDTETGKNYALVGLTNAVSFVDITDPTEPIVVGRLFESDISAKYKILTDPNYEACKVGIGDTEYSKSLTEGSSWRDHKVFNDHLFIGSDAQSHGIQVFDLSKLRSYNGTFLEFNEDALYTGLANSHNVVINEETGYAYAVGATNADTCSSGGLHILDINDPKNPEFAGCYDDQEPPRRRTNSAYIHDAQCIIYDGPDSDYSGREICFGAAERSLVIADVTDKDSLQTISFATQPNMYYAHQGWVTEDQKYFFMNDELDETNLGRNTKTYIFDISDLDNPQFVDFYTHNTFSIDHNLYLKGDHIFATNYNAGLRILKINDPSSADLSLTAFFDTQPNTDENSFNGTWSNYPYFENGVIIVSDISDGLFILQPDLD